MEINFKGRNKIRLLIPEEKYQDTLAFYRDILLFTVHEIPTDKHDIIECHEMRFGSNILMLESVTSITNPQMELEIETTDITIAKNYLNINDVETRSEVKIDKSTAFTIMDPSGTILSIKQVKSNTTT